MQLDQNLFNGANGALFQALPFWGSLCVVGVVGASVVQALRPAWKRRSRAESGELDELSVFFGGKSVASDAKGVRGFKCFAGAPEAPADHHSMTTTSVAYSSDRRAFVTAATDGKVLLWKAGKPERVVSEGSSPVWTTAVVGSALVSGSEDGILTVVDLDSSGTKKVISGHLAAPELELSGHAQGLTDVVVVGDKAATASLDGSVKVWDLKTGKCLGTLQGHGLQVTSLVALSGATIASGSADGSIRIWSLETLECLKAIEWAHATSVTGVHRVLDNHVVSTGWDATVKLWDPATVKLKGTMGPPKDRTTKDKDNGVCASGVASDSKVVACYFGGKVVVWDCKACRTVSEKDVKGFTSSVGVDAEGKTAILGLSSGECQSMDV
ncbi:WD40 repeat domain-containing protein [Chloropicon primus]|uniref:WD40 repeat domain-containing protein n=1 Tax=Chloropicon primus TaxID=1764295 RepID=A0A5B8MCF3_9CHLO|nr:WD40 repeat domain-containing protein [Chloropicon primus]|eukprot:QDZ17724.1 WD40 repeat domain-containing protein [Chloropicon primus]